MECLGHSYAYELDNVHVALVSHLHVLAPGSGSIASFAWESNIQHCVEMSTMQGSDAKAIGRPMLTRCHEDFLAWLQLFPARW
jgi:hypothetical protein